MLAPQPTVTYLGITSQLPSPYGPFSSGGSQEAASFLNYAMSSSTIVNVLGTDVENTSGAGQLVHLNSNQIESFINGTPSDLNSQTMGYGLQFFHELTHTDLGQLYHNSPTPLVDPSGPGTGVVVDYINKIRLELGSSYGQRTNYQSISDHGLTYVPFSSVNGKTRIYYNR